MKSTLSEEEPFYQTLSCYLIVSTYKRKNAKLATDLKTVRLQLSAFQFLILIKPRNSTDE